MEPTPTYTAGNQLDNYLSADQQERLLSILSQLAESNAWGKVSLVIEQGKIVFLETTVSIKLDIIKSI